MVSTSHIFMTTFNVLQLGIGICLNSCVLVYSFQNLKNRLSINPTNLIYSVKGLVNIFLQMVMAAEVMMVMLWPNLFFIREVNLTLTFLMLSPIFYNYWLTGWLCAHYCISISDFTHKFLVGFKRVITSSLPQVLLLSSICSLGMSVLSMWEMDEASSTTNTTDNTPTIAFFMAPEYRLMATLLGCCLPFCLGLVSIGVTTLTLIRHIKKMRQKFSGSNCPNLQVLINTTRTMILFLTLSVIFYIIGLMLLTTYYVSFNLMVISNLSFMTFPLVEAFVIIQTIPKLRKMILGKLCVMCCQQGLETKNVT